MRKLPLIETCVCGLGPPFEEFNAPNGLACERCVCGVIHLITSETRAEVEAQYNGFYHASDDRHPGCRPYRERYDHDRKVAALRYDRYSTTMGGGLNRRIAALDVGAANGAWVDWLRDAGLDSLGVDPDPGMARDGIRTGTIKAFDRVPRFGLITYHDVLEHIVEPRRELDHARARLLRGGWLIVDVPDVSIEAGHHHYKTEHLWYFTERALREMFVDAQLDVRLVDLPVPGKLVVYGQAV